MESKVKEPAFHHLDKWQWKANVVEAIQAMEKEHGPLKVLVQQVRVHTCKNNGDISIHEFKAETLINGKKVIISDAFSVLWLMEWGIIRHWNSINLSEKFLNTTIGKRWLGYLIQECKPQYLVN
ncbi:hypothetical protein MXL46_09275 [Heyndrickxia sporothermodurans]|uniref:Uncharacterized protein n=1 Tax=Siminovitchia thermophila TaxID=1245522 RepID=A0ABS2R8N8_9BACI|nr:MULTISPECIES: hypothetical protein [Bacillaceae]MBM7716007.1 hypothetical protein [Siminovitchia thermophila]MEB6549284.1 hypothetical protein [Heyndrickxia sporothermodurans]